MAVCVCLKSAYIDAMSEEKPFRIVSDFQPAGDQPEAIAALAKGLKDGLTDQVLLGVTGSGKTFTVAHIIQEMQRPLRQPHVVTMRDRRAGKSQTPGQSPD